MSSPVIELPVMVAIEPPLDRDADVIAAEATLVAFRLAPQSSAMPVKSDEPEIVRPETVTETDGPPLIAIWLPPVAADGADRRRGGPRAG